MQTSLFDGSGDAKQRREALRATERRIVSFFPSLGSSRKPTELAEASDMINEQQALFVPSFSYPCCVATPSYSSRT